MMPTTTSLMVSVIVLCAVFCVPLTQSFAPTTSHVHAFHTVGVDIGKKRRRHCHFSSSSPSIIQQQESVNDQLQDSHLKSAENVTAFPEMTKALATAATTELDHVKATVQGRRHHRFRNALPGFLHLGKINDGDNSDTTTTTLDEQILKVALPSMMNLAVVPLVNSVDTFFVGRMGLALALAGQAAANQAFFTIYFLVAFIPTITAPLVAAAVASGNPDEAKRRVCESIFLCNVLGALGTFFLVAFPRIALSSVLPTVVGGATTTTASSAMDYAVPYLQIRALGLMPALISATGFAAFRGAMDTVTPLKVSLATNVLNLVLDPLFIFATPLRVCGAALATAAAETLSGLTYLSLLLKRNLVSMKLLFRQPPSWSSLRPLITSGLSVLGRQLVLNCGMLAAARRAQSMDPTTGIAAAAYGIVMQMYIVGVVVHVALQGTAAALVPAALAQKPSNINTTETESTTATSSSSTTTTSHSSYAAAVVADGKERARQVADRTFGWGILVGIMLAAAQYVALPFLVPLFSTLPQVQEAVRRPALLLSLLHIINGPVFVGEGIMLGLGSFRDLLLVTGVGILTMVACLASPLGSRLDGILTSFVIFSAVQAVGVVAHYLRIGPLAVRLPPQGRGKRNKSGKQSLRARLKGIRLAFGR